MRDYHAMKSLDYNHHGTCTIDAGKERIKSKTGHRIQDRKEHITRKKKVPLSRSIKEELAAS
jgi:hypothetical protein